MSITEGRSQSKDVFSRVGLMSHTIVLINGCFHNGPVICPRSVIMA